MDQELYKVLRDSGWAPGRIVDDELVLGTIANIERMGHQSVGALYPILREFLGLRLGRGGEPGVSAARSVIEIDPMLCVDEEERFERVGRLVGEQIAPLGEIGEGRAFLGVGVSGSIYYFDMEVWRAGRSWQEAARRLLLGHRAEMWDTECERWTLNW